VTFHDPVRAHCGGRFLRRLDYRLSVIIRQPRTVPAVLRAKLRRRQVGPGTNYGLLAERHAVTGVDDERVLAKLREHRLEIVSHEREWRAHFRATEFMFRLLRQPTGFNLIARRTR
jgi:hypothetical protein